MAYDPEGSYEAIRRAAGAIGVAKLNARITEAIPAPDVPPITVTGWPAMAVWGTTPLGIDLSRPEPDPPPPEPPAPPASSPPRSRRRSPGNTPLTHVHVDPPKASDDVGRQAPDQQVRSEPGSSPGGTKVTHFTCNSCGSSFSGKSLPERCPSCKSHEIESVDQASSSSAGGPVSHRPQHDVGASPARRRSPRDDF